MTLRDAALAIFQAALESGHVRSLLQRAVCLDGSRLAAGSAAFDLAGIRRLLVLGAGKASGAMAQSLEEMLGDRIAEGLVVVKDGYRAPTKRVRLLEAAHPIPDERGARAARELLALARNARADDLVVVLISGGGSALTPAPVPPITLAEKRALTEQFLAAGATVSELNVVRKHCSQFKGGQLAKAAAPAPVVSLILSDVIGDAPDVVASGPTAPDETTFADALAVVERFGLRDRIPTSVVRRLEQGARGEISETPKPRDPLFDRVTNHIIGNNRMVVEAAETRARQLGFNTHLRTRALQGEAQEVARQFADLARGIRMNGKPVSPPACVIAGGETTVTVRGRGKGGRCQEFCLAGALGLHGMPDVFVLAAGTDGSDGPTDAAGATADGETVSRAARRGLDASAGLAENDSFGFFSALGDLVITGPTNTNLLDLYLLLVGPLPQK
ncbi:MAG: glycerate kinase [Candidatus Rokubacteria bacterium]|nr:glycerate kinase [Candidatus Rokubacteria bacterium]